MIQGGGFDENFKEKATRDAIENEADNGLSNDVGTIAMARTQAPHSASAQFFINVKQLFPKPYFKNCTRLGLCCIR